MKFLALLFLAGVALAAPFYEGDDDGVELPFKDKEKFKFQTDDDVKTELGEKLKERLDYVLEQIRYHVEEGYGFKDDFFYQAKVLFQKLADMKIDVGDRTKYFEELTEKSKNHWKNVIDRLLKETRSFADEPEFGKKLREQLVQILEKMVDAFDKGEGIREADQEKFKEIKQKLKDLRIDFGDRAKELMEIMKEKSKEFLKKIFDRLKLQESSNSMFDNDDIKTELGKKLKEHFDQILEKVKDAIENGKVVKEDTIVKLKEIREKLRDLRVELGDRAKELIAQLKEKAKDYWQKFLDRLGGKEKREIEQAESIFEVFRKLKELLKSKLDADQLKEKVEKLFGKGSEFANQLINALKEKGEKGKNKILDWIDKVLGDRETRSIKEVFEKIKNYFKDLNIELKEKFVKFGQWAKEQYEKGLEKGKTKAENIKKIAEEFIRDYKQVSKDVAEEALEFFREYKEDLGRVFDDVKDKVKEVVNRDN